MDPTDTIVLPLRLLDWYREMGVDAAVGGEAIDWLARGTVKPGAEFVLPTPAVTPVAARATAKRAPA